MKRYNTAYNTILESLKDPKDNPCWTGYKPVGTKEKAGKTVPNCVPKEESANKKSKDMARVNAGAMSKAEFDVKWNKPVKKSLAGPGGLYKNLVKEEGAKKKDKNPLEDIAKHFMSYALKKLGIEKAPKIKLDKDTARAKELKAMGGYMPGDHTIWVYTGNRNAADVLRTLGHELVHARQKETKPEGSLDGSTGSEDENEANSLAGVLLREYGARRPEIYE